MNVLFVKGKNVLFFLSRRVLLRFLFHENKSHLSNPSNPPLFPITPLRQAGGNKCLCNMPRVSCGCAMICASEFASPFCGAIKNSRYYSFHAPCEFNKYLNYLNQWIINKQRYVNIGLMTSLVHLNLTS